MDPLSAAASIVGLVTAVGKVYTLLDYVSSVRNAPATIRDAKDEVGHAQLALRSMERCLNRLASLNPDRTALIQVDDLRVTLADAMMAFSEFEALLRDLTRLARLRAAIAWPKYAKALEEHMVKVQRYKSSLTLMLNILQCETQIEASESQERLHALIESVMEENQVLKQIMNDSQDSFDARSTFSRRHLDDRSTIWLGGDDEEDDAATIRTSNTIATIRGLRNGFQSKVMALTFEKILEQSWVYKRNQRNECDSSFISTAGRSHAWSVFSGFSLADVSVLSVIAMPLTTLDLSNGKHYDIEVRNGDSTGPTEGPGISDTSISQPRYLPSLELEDFEFPWTTRHQEEDQLRQQIDEARSNTMMVLSGAYDGKDTRTTPLASNEDNKLVGGNDKRPEDDASDSKSDEGEEDEDEELWSCQGCKQILEEGKAYELEDKHWHLDCFRCIRCNSLQGDDTNIGLLGNNDIICNDCMYDCSACGNKIEHMVILLADQTLCQSCFTCKSCMSPIENLKYARTSDGILCFPCHEATFTPRSQEVLRSTRVC